MFLRKAAIFKLFIIVISEWERFSWIDFSEFLLCWLEQLNNLFHDADFQLHFFNIPKNTNKQPYSNYAN